MKYPLRFAAFAALMVVPFLRFLVENRFSLLRSESVVAAGLFCLPALLYASFGRRVFVPLLIVCSVIVAGDSFRQQSAAIVSLSLVAAAAILGAVLCAAAYSLKDRFPQTLIIFSLTFFAGQFLRTPPVSLASAGSQEVQPPGHVLYLILDGHIGLAGFPLGIPACAQARMDVESTLDAHAFTTYTNATSNYGVTLLSIPSILNQQLPDTPEQFTRSHTTGGATIVSPNKLFAEYATRDYNVVVYQHRSIDYAAGSPDVDRTVDYSSEIGGLELVPDWSRRVLWLVGDYQGSAPWLSKARAFLPFRAGFRRTGTLAVRSVWPGPLASDIAKTPQKALFFVHLLVPHEPYVYRADGSVRPIADWMSDTPVPPLESAPYRARFTAYCEQVSALSHQLDAFLEQLRTSGELDTMTVVIHGDHGSRIYLKGGDRRQQLLNQFSALLAIHTPASRVATRNKESGSVMRFLSRDFRAHPVDTTRANSIFWVNENGVPSEIPIQELWRQ